MICVWMRQYRDVDDVCPIIRLHAKIKRATAEPTRLDGALVLCPSTPIAYLKE